MKKKLFFRTKKTIEFFEISRMTLHRWRKKEGFPQPLKNGGVVLYDINAIVTWLEKGQKNA